MPTGDERPGGREEASAQQDAASGPEAGTSDRRRFPRIQLALTVGLRFPSTEAVQESRTVDISEGGAFIRMSQPRAEGTTIRLQLDVGGRKLAIGGVVVRCVRPGEGEPPGIGVLFTELRPEDAVFVQGLVRERLRSPE